MDKFVYTAIFGDYEELKDPLVMTPGWKYICFTDQPLKSDKWMVLPLEQTEETSLLQARMVKLAGWQLLEAKHTMWIDGSFTINCDLNEWWDKYYKGGMTCIQHPIRNCFYKEAEACIKHKRGNAELIQKQVNQYLEEGLPRDNGIISSGILMREKHPLVGMICNQWYEAIRP